MSRAQKNLVKIRDFSLLAKNICRFCAFSGERVRGRVIFGLVLGDTVHETGASSADVVMLPWCSLC